ncbi:MAG: thiamine pyrophosphate-requiring protein [Rhodospirillaceae bacterium]|jgi:acetolactate synthase I/II/III large subunit|nr:thiamine pyrophosphate-requiring protein [Rhodospirillaceae bacterium]MBT5455681.1 thiamine pyrophosphate-requiring protein [Rhodospirillaceae bacterium]
MSPDNTQATAQTPIETTGDAIVASMAAGGVDHLFFTSGSEIGFYQEAVAKARAHGHNNPIRLITVPHEHISLNAALGYAAVSGRPAATAVHVDVGTLHMGGAIHTAWRSGLPVVMTAGYPPTAATGSMPGARDEGGHLWMQETYDQNGIVRNYTKWDHQLAYQDNPGLVASRAIQIARSQPAGPVYISVPKELSLMKVTEPKFPSAIQLGIVEAPAPDAASVREITEHLMGANQPVVIVSRSGRNPDSVAALVTLCELLGLAVVESGQMAFLCFPSTHPLYQDQSALDGADAVLVLDCEVPWIPGRNDPADGAYIADVTFDPIKMRTPIYEFVANKRLAADPLLTIEAITEAAQGLLTDADRQRIAGRSETLAAASKARHAADEKAALAVANDTPIDPKWLSYQIGAAIDDNCIVLNDTLGPSGVRSYLACDRPGSLFCATGSSGGWAPGAAFGAKLAAPDRDVIAVTGDGFYMFGTPAPALWAAAHHGAPFLTIVYTNRSYTTGTVGVVRSFGPDSYASKADYEGGYFDPPIDFAKEAEAAGAYGENVSDPADVAAALQRGLEQVRSGKPAVISVWLKRLIDGG